MCTEHLSMRTKSPWIFPASDTHQIRPGWWSHCHQYQLPVMATRKRTNCWSAQSRHHRKPVEETHDYLYCWERTKLLEANAFTHTRALRPNMKLNISNSQEWARPAGPGTVHQGRTKSLSDCSLPLLGSLQACFKKMLKRTTILTLKTSTSRIRHLWKIHDLW